MSKHRTSDQWRVLVDQQRDSGLSAVRFCKQENIGYASFCNWRRRLSCDNEKSQDSGKSEFLDLTSLMAGSQDSGSGWNIVLTLGGGVQLKLSQGS